MNCITQYISYYYHYYCVPQKTSKKTDVINKPGVSKIEIDNTYDLIFSNTTNSSKKLNIVLYEIYNYGLSIDNKQSSSIFLYNNKVYKISLPKNTKRYLSIIHTLRNYNLKNVLIPEEIYYNKYQNEIVQKYHYYPDGDLFDYFYNNKLSLQDIISIFIQIVTIVNDLHKITLVHLDLKLENFLIYKHNNKIKILLIDFDFTHINDNINFYGGTEQYASYEIRNCKQIQNWNCCDIWSICVILYILLFREFPWKNSNVDELTFIDYINNYTSNYWYNKLSTLEIDENSRIIFSKIFNYGFNLNNSERCDITVFLDILKDI